MIGGWSIAAAAAFLFGPAFPAKEDIVVFLPPYFIGCHHLAADTAGYAFLFFFRSILFRHGRHLEQIFSIHLNKGSRERYTP